MKLRPARPLQTIDWFNAPSPITLESLRGKVVLVEAFQMLCPGCVSHSLPQAMRARALFSEEDVAVIGLHSVFEHHGAQGTKEALEAFLHEYRISFPVGIDAPSDRGGPPKTMSAYQMQGTPTTILIDRDGNLRKQKFGRDEDMLLGAEIMSLLREGATPASAASDTPEDDGCTDDGCPLPTG
ncbi:MAG: alkyl hydroperoxide reductase [Parvularcula sp.]|nr:alkyl hydroperoxide reductase [Parvularcula sp.]